jgi:hypothetical protein
VRAEHGRHVVGVLEALEERSQPAVVRRGRVLGQECHVLAAREGHHPVARAAMRELALRDLVDDRAVAAGDLERAVRRAGVHHEDLELAVDALAAHGLEHLVEVAGAVQHRDGDGDRAHPPRRRRRIAAARPSSIPAGSRTKRFA